MDLNAHDGSENTTHEKSEGLYRWLSTFPAFLILLTVVLLNTSHAIHAQLLLFGEAQWEGYYQLRVDPQAPACNPDQDIEQALSHNFDLVVYSCYIRSTVWYLMACKKALSVSCSSSELSLCS